MFLSCDAIHRCRDIRRPMLKFALKLADEKGSLLLIAFFKDLADAHQHRPRHRRNGCGHREREKQRAASVAGSRRVLQRSIGQIGRSVRAQMQIAHPARSHRHAANQEAE